jgi:organic radical activating enzyme
MDQTVPREINYLRMSITDRCQLRCFYCTSWQHFRKLPTREILSYEELLRLAGIAASLGIRKVRVIGGEPLVRRGWWILLKTYASSRPRRNLPHHQRCAASMCKVKFTRVVWYPVKIQDSLLFVVPWSDETTRN